MSRVAAWYIDGVVRVAIWLALVAACSSKAPPSPEPLVVPHDAGSDAEVVAADPLSEAPIGRAPGRPVARAARPIDVILRSSPSGAAVAVDGVQVGTTPTYWAGDANGRDHEFLFVRKGYAYARYRFVPVTSGVVHARLEPIAEDSPASAPPEMLPMRPPEPFAPPPVIRRPPPPADAAVVEPDAPAVDGTAPPFGGADSRGHAPAVEPAAEPAAAAAGPPP